MSVGSNIRKRRYELKMSQQELADALGYKTRSTIAKIESGENDVSQKKLMRIASVLETTVETLVSGASLETPFSPFPFDFSTPKRNRNAVIILAGGKSGRNNQNIPSQFINVKGKPILVYCMNTYQSHPAVDDIFVVCLKGWETIVKAYAEQYGISKLKGIITGGNSGVASLKNALDFMKGKYSADDIVMVQESTRPLVTSEMISNLLQAGIEKGSATFCHSMNDYIQFDISGRHAKYLNRDTIIAMQSPEVHRFSLINATFKKAEEKNHSLNESCLTMLMYNLGQNINFIESSINNIKITREEDIAAFSTLLTQNN